MIDYLIGAVSLAILFLLLGIVVGVIWWLLSDEDIRGYLLHNKPKDDKRAKGYWVCRQSFLNPIRYSCSICDFEWPPSIDIDPNKNLLYFCPCCGNRLIEEAEDDR